MRAVLGPVQAVAAVAPSRRLLGPCLHFRRGLGDVRRPQQEVVVGVDQGLFFGAAGLFFFLAGAGAFFFFDAARRGRSSSGAFFLDAARRGGRSSSDSEDDDSSGGGALRLGGARFGAGFFLAAGFEDGRS